MDSAPDNPYRSPASDLPGVVEGEEGKPRLADWQRVLRSWELLRIPYNLLIGATGVLSVWSQAVQLLSLEVLFGMLLYASAANFCFFLGPAIEIHLNSIGLRSSYTRWLLFAAGTILGMFLTLALCLEVANDLVLIPDQM